MTTDPAGSDRTDERVTTLKGALESLWWAWSETAESEKHRGLMRLEWQEFGVALASLAADAAEARPWTCLVCESPLTPDERTNGCETCRAAVADRDRLASLLAENQWNGNAWNAAYPCICCGVDEPNHDAGCEVAAALAGREGSDRG